MSLANNVRSIEAQRRQNSQGIFYWGIGRVTSEENIKRMLTELKGEPLMVMFCPTISTPRPKDSRGIDSHVKEVRRWTNPSTRSGAPYVDYPPEAEVVSHPEEKPSHYALVCRSLEPLAIHKNGPKFSRSDLTTFPNGKSLGNASGSIYAARHTPSTTGEKNRQVFMQAELVDPYVLKFSVEHSKVIHGRMDWETGRYQEIG